MDVEAFLLCDAATDQLGKLNILGAFDNIRARKMPFVLPGCAIAGRIRFSRIEDGNHRLKVNLIDEDGKEVIPALEGNLAVKIGPDTEFAVVNFVLNIQRLKFEKYGAYRIDLAVDGRQEASLPLFVRNPQQ